MHGLRLQPLDNAHPPRHDLDVMGEDRQIRFSFDALSADDSERGKSKEDSKIRGVKELFCKPPQVPSEESEESSTSFSHPSPSALECDWSSYVHPGHRTFLLSGKSSQPGSSYSGGGGVSNLAASSALRVSGLLQEKILSDQALHRTRDQVPQVHSTIQRSVHASVNAGPVWTSDPSSSSGIAPVRQEDKRSISVTGIEYLRLNESTRVNLPPPLAHEGAAATSLHLNHLPETLDQPALQEPMRVSSLQSDDHHLGPAVWTSSDESEDGQLDNGKRRQRQLQKYSESEQVSRISAQPHPQPHKTSQKSYEVIDALTPRRRTQERAQHFLTAQSTPNENMATERTQAPVAPLSERAEQPEKTFEEKVIGEKSHPTRWKGRRRREAVKVRMIRVAHRY